MHTPTWTKDSELNEFARAFSRKRPWLYHLTASMNIPRIRRKKRLQCATELMNASGCSNLHRSHRKESIVVRICDENVQIRDQRLLNEKNMRLPPDYSFKDDVACLNSLVFFWPGSAHGPKRPGVGHFDSYRHECPRLIRVQTQDLFDINLPVSPRFSRYNSGAPRQYKGRAMPRGPRVFTFGNECRRVSKVVEVVYCTEVRLPDATEMGEDPNGPWHSLFGEQPH